MSLFKSPWILISTAEFGPQLLEQIQMARQGQAPCLQLRLKGASRSEIIQAREWLLEYYQSPNHCAILNDHPDLIHLTPCHGVHLGNTDLHPVRARNLLGNEKIIGKTINSQSDANQLSRYPANTVDYMGIGPWRWTPTKSNLSPILEQETMRQIIQLNPQIPAFAIGGIQKDDLNSALKLGFTGVALAGAVWNSPDPIGEIQTWNSLFVQGL